MENRADSGLGFLLRYENIAWYADGAVKILDRRVYPTKVECSTVAEVAQCIADMVTQSAGPYTAAAMGMALAAYECKDLSDGEKLGYMQNSAHILSNARPTTTDRMSRICNPCLDIAVQNVSNWGRVPELIVQCGDEQQQIQKNRADGKTFSRATATKCSCYDTVLCRNYHRAVNKGRKGAEQEVKIFFVARLDRIFKGQGLLPAL